MTRRWLPLALLAWITAAPFAWVTAPARAQGGLQNAPVYRPPLRGAPAGRIGGGTRSIAARDVPQAPVPRESPIAVALAPDHPGLTTAEQPALYWLLARPAPRDLEVSLGEVGAVRPLLKTRIAAPDRPGVHRLGLADHGVRLERGKRYQWSVGVAPDDPTRPPDPVAGAAIERVAPPAELSASDRGDARALARAGLWYDALAVISDMIAAAPADSTLRAHRASLLEQVGLTEAARLDRGR